MNVPSTQLDSVEACLFLLLLRQLSNVIYKSSIVFDDMKIVRKFIR